MYGCIWLLAISCTVHADEGSMLHLPTHASMVTSVWLDVTSQKQLEAVAATFGEFATMSQNNIWSCLYVGHQSTFDQLFRNQKISRHTEEFVNL